MCEVVLNFKGAVGPSFEALLYVSFSQLVIQSVLARVVLSMVLPVENVG